MGLFDTILDTTNQYTANVPNLSTINNVVDTVNQYTSDISDLASSVSGLGQQFSLGGIGNNRQPSSFIIILNRGGDTLVKDTIPFQFMPNIIRDSKSAVYNDIPIIARSVPVKNYSYTSSRLMSFTLEFFVSPEQGMDFSPRDIQSRIDLLRSLVYPDYSGFVVKPPSRCVVAIGDQTNFIGICKSVSVSYSNHSPWDINPPILTHHATVDLTFEEVLNIPLSSTEISMGTDAAPGEYSGTFSPGGVLGGTGSSIAPVIEPEVQGPAYTPAGTPTGEF